LWNRDAVQPQGSLDLSPGGGVTALLSVGRDRWIGREDGRVEIHGAAGSPSVALPPPATVTPGKDERVLALAWQEERRLVAVGTAAGRLIVLDAGKGSIRADLDVDEYLRITSLAFDPSGRWLAAGTGEGSIVLVDVASLTESQRYPRINGGVVTLAFTNDGRLAVVSGYGVLAILAEQEGEFTRERSANLPGLIASAAIDGARDRLALGDVSGRVHLRNLFGEPIGFETLHGHGDSVSALAFGVDEDTLVSASSDGTVAIWDLAGNAGPSTPLPSFAPEPSVLRIDGDGNLRAAATTTGTAGVWRLRDQSWVLELDLIEATRAAAGPDALDSRSGDKPEAGFIPIGYNEIPSLAMDGTGSRIVWSTKGGALLRADLDADAGPPVVLKPAGDDVPGELTISRDGRVAASLSPRGATLFPMDRTGSVPVEPAGTTVRSLALDPRGETLALGFEDGRVALYRADRGSAISRPVKIHDGPVAGLSFTEDGQLVSFGSGGGGADRTVAVSTPSRLASARRLQSRQAGGAVSTHIIAHAIDWRRVL
jgi:WD40 repeat protein